MASVAKPDSGRPLIKPDGSALYILQLYLDELEVLINAIETGVGFNLPTSDPGVSGLLWNDAGTVKVST